MPEPERPLSPASTFVRPAPAAPDGLACSRFQKQFVIRLRGRQITSSTVELKSADGRLGVGADTTDVPRAEYVSFGVIYWRVNSSARILSGPSELPLSLRLIIYKDTLYFSFFGILLYLLNI